MKINLNMSSLGNVKDNFDSLQNKYGGFGLPQVQVAVNGKKFKDKRGLAVISRVSVELSSGFEASVASFRVYNLFDTSTSQYRLKDISDSMQLGNAIEVSLGYIGQLCPVFTGFISEVHYLLEEGDVPCLEVHAMDAKGIMMAGRYAQQLTARSYGEAVREVLSRTAIEKLKSSGAISSIDVEATPDDPSQNPGQTEKLRKTHRMDMVSESDYEFIVKAAKKHNFEFYVENGRVIFRRAKRGAGTLMEIGVGKGVTGFDIGYGLTGLVGEVEVRSTDPSKSDSITAKKKIPPATISPSRNARALVAGSHKVYIDPSISSPKQAGTRAESLVEEISFRLGSLDCECVGMPELRPGYYVDFVGAGAPADNHFYITDVVHELDDIKGYTTKLTGKASEVKK